MSVVSPVGGEVAFTPGTGCVVRGDVEDQTIRSSSVLVLSIVLEEIMVSFNLILFSYSIDTVYS